ncbi:MAG: hypothetical protein HY272_14515 [Gammaproteobacteria bacterium]|nr:hypothetical protein [Gammaproteobacteria bacterium]
MNDPKPPFTQPVSQNTYEDEISLVDLWLTLAKHKTVILSIAATCTLGGMVFGFISSVKHTYVTAIQLGTPSLESTKSTITKLEKLFIPTTQAALDSPVGLKVDSPDDKLILLESTTTEDKVDAVRTLHTAISKRLIEDHAVLFEKQLTSLKTLADNYATTLRDLQNNNYAGALGENINALKDKIAHTKSATDTQDRLKLELKFAHSELAREQQQIKVAGIDTQTKLDQLRMQIATAQNTSLISTASEYERKGKSPLVMGVLGLVLGGILGVFAAFLMEFALKVKSAKAQA